MLDHNHALLTLDGEHILLFQPGQNFVHPVSLHAHPGDTDDVGAREPVPVYRLDIFVEQGHRVFARRQRGQQRQTGDGQIGPLAQERQRVFQAPVGRLELRIDQDNVGHEFATP